VRYRYPGDAADRDEARDAYQTAISLRRLLRARLELSEENMM
jgi:hypothetical protein